MSREILGYSNYFFDAMKKLKRRPVGRPRFVEGEALSIKIQIRLRPDEVQAMKKRADRKGISLSKWSRKVLLSEVEREHN